MRPIVIPGSAGLKLDGLYGRHDRIDNPTVLILPPNYTQGSEQLSWAHQCMMCLFLRAGFNVLTTRYRKLKNTEYSRFDGRENFDLIDAKYAFQWLQATHPNSRQYWIAGIDYGAYLAMQLLMRNTKIDAFVCFSVPCLTYDLGFLTPCPAHGLVIHGASDKTTPIESVERFVAEKNNQKERHANIELVVLEETAEEVVVQADQTKFIRAIAEYLERFYSADEPVLRTPSA